MSPTKKANRGSAGNRGIGLSGVGGGVGMVELPFLPQRAGVHTVWVMLPFRVLVCHRHILFFCSSTRSSGMQPHGEMNAQTPGTHKCSFRNVDSIPSPWRGLRERERERECGLWNSLYIDLSTSEYTWNSFSLITAWLIVAVVSNSAIKCCYLSPRLRQLNLLEMPDAFHTEALQESKWSERETGRGRTGSRERESRSLSCRLYWYALALRQHSK